jgi:predicted O-linked N-acetylglucosamine transferase (SPINDLY family)
VLTCLGSSFAGRVGASINNAIGMPELVTRSPAEYEALALKIARDPALCASLKAKLARHRGTYPLFDTARLTRNVEAAYRRMWQIYRDGRPPENFAVESRA